MQGSGRSVAAACLLLRCKNSADGSPQGPVGKSDSISLRFAIYHIHCLEEIASCLCALCYCIFDLQHASARPRNEGDLTEPSKKSLNAKGHGMYFQWNIILVPAVHKMQLLNDMCLMEWQEKETKTGFARCMDSPFRMNESP